jgi:hypothetical protein
MARFLLRRTLSGWIEADDASRAAARKFNVGDTYKADIVKPRSLKALNRYWALVDIILDNTDMFKAKEQVSDYLKLASGHCSPFMQRSTGEVYLLPNSINFDSLGEDEFQEVWSRIIDVVCKDILPGVTEDEINVEIQKLCGLAR